MRKHLAALAALSALALPASAQASAIISFPSTTVIPANPGGNMFISELNGLGMDVFASLGASIVLDADHIIRFEFLGSESGYDDTFSVAGTGTTHTETSPHTPGENHFAAPILLGSAAFAAGTNFASILNFTSSGGNPATVGDAGFSIFLPRAFTSGTTVNEFYVGYDDYISGDDNHDDFIVRATLFGTAPEPSTWLLMILGFGAVGFTMRRRSNVERIRVTYA